MTKKLTIKKAEKRVRHLFFDPFCNEVKSILLEFQRSYASMIPDYPILGSLLNASAMTLSLGMISVMVPSLYCLYA